MGKGLSLCFFYGPTDVRHFTTPRTILKFVGYAFSLKDMTLLRMGTCGIESLSFTFIVICLKLLQPQYKRPLVLSTVEDQTLLNMTMYEQGCKFSDFCLVSENFTSKYLKMVFEISSL